MQGSAVDPAKRIRAAVIHDLIREGWRPPRPTLEQTGRVIDDIAALPAQSTLELTGHELRILKFAADGRSATEIAAATSRTNNTIVQSQRAIRRKLGARTMAHAVAIGYRQGILY